MSSRFVIFSIVAAIAVLSSCKKEEEEETKDYLDGDIEISFPEFLHPGDILKFDVDTMSTLVKTDGDSVNIGYYFYDSYSDIQDTVRLKDGTVVLKEYTFMAPDTLSTFKLSVTGFADGHYTSTASQEYTVVRDGLNGYSSITNFDIVSTDKTLKDPRDGKSYYYTTIGGVDWMRQNLAWEGSGHPYKDSPAMNNMYGLFYSQTEAKSACPEGWTLPSESDWVKMASDLGCSAASGEIFPGISGKLMENIYFNSERMWEYWPDVKIDNAARFSAMPVGYAIIEDGECHFDEYGKYAMFWSSDNVGVKGSFRYLYEDKTGVYYGLLDPDETLMSVRCIRK